MCRESVLNIVQPALQVIVEAGYDRSVPFGDPTPFELIPSVDPATFTLEFANGVVQGADNALELFGASSCRTSASSRASSVRQKRGPNKPSAFPTTSVVTELNTAFDPFTLFTDLERPIGEGIEDLLTATGVQQALDPILGLIGPLGELFTG